MPEIPDLNIFRKNLAKKLEGKQLAEINIVNPRKLKIPVADLKKALNGKKLLAIERKGKELHFHFEGHTLGIHLMLHGALFWFGDKYNKALTIAELHFADGTSLAITDMQKAVLLTLDPEPKEAPDAMDMPNGYLKEAVKESKKYIKTALTEGKIVQGIGNAYVDEILYAAGISPYSKADKVPDKKIET
jgi:formamidopyrimidine-DNA glycosylase